MLHSDRRTILPGVRLRCIQTDQFRSGYFSLSLLRPLDEGEAAKNALLMNVLRRGTRTLPDMEKLAEALDELYGASVEPVLRQMGETMAIGFSAAFPDDRYLPRGEAVLEKLIDLTGELLLDPATHGGLLNAAYVTSERVNLRDRIQAVVNDKRSYALMRLRALMCAEEPYGVYPLGTAESAEKITNLTLTKHYKTVLATSPVELFYCGSAEPERVALAVQRAFRALPGGEERAIPEPIPKNDCGETRYVTEYLDVEQGNLAIGFRLGESMDRPDYPALAVFNELYGGGPSSRLFREVREARSLCYHAGAGIERYKGLMTVMAGIAFESYDEALEAILLELGRCAQGDFTDQELETARISVASSYRMAQDEPSSLCGFHLGQDLLGVGGDLRQYAALALEVTAEDVRRVARSAKPDLVYFLRREAAQ